MNAMKLAKILLDKQDELELTETLDLLRDQYYDEIYDRYEEIFHECLQLYSFDEFLDIVIYDEVLDESVFTFGFLWLKKISLYIGGYQNNLQSKINAFVKKMVPDIDLESLPSADIYTDLDGTDNFMEYMTQLDELISPYDQKILMVYEDLYCVGAFHIFILKPEMVQDIRYHWYDKNLYIVDWYGKQGL